MPRTILITGCSSGIGQALARELHRRGETVIATARRRDDLAELAAAGLQVHALDVTLADSRDRLMTWLDAQGLAVDVLVNNAGYGAMGPLLDMPDERLRHQFDANVFGLLAMTQALVPAMAARGRGLVVNVGSVSGVLVTPFSGAYCATKAAVHALSDALRLELAPFNVQVMVVQPGAIASEFGANASREVHAWLPDDSLYAPVRDAIAARANASQQHATPASEFVAAMADALLAEHPPAYVRIGSGSTLLPFLRYGLPRRLLDRILRRRFRLDQPLPVSPSSR